jgi:hypothetical protein
MIPVFLLIGLAAAMGLMTTTRADREQVGRETIKPLEPWCALIILVIWGAVLIPQIPKILRHFSG